MTKADQESMSLRGNARGLHIRTTFLKNHKNGFDDKLRTKTRSNAYESSPTVIYDNGKARHSTQDRKHYRRAFFMSKYLKYLII